jgi:hypothetical protein
MSIFSMKSIRKTALNKCVTRTNGGLTSRKVILETVIL